MSVGPGSSVWSPVYCSGDEAMEVAVVTTGILGSAEFKIATWRHYHGWPLLVCTVSVSCSSRAEKLDRPTCRVTLAGTCPARREGVHATTRPLLDNTGIDSWAISVSGSG